MFQEIDNRNMKTEIKINECQKTSYPHFQS
jgi:hypothetical protein